MVDRPATQRIVRAVGVGRITSAVILARNEQGVGGEGLGNVVIDAVSRRQDDRSARRCISDCRTRTHVGLISHREQNAPRCGLHIATTRPALVRDIATAAASATATATGELDGFGCRADSSASLFTDDDVPLPVAVRESLQVGLPCIATRK